MKVLNHTQGQDPEPRRLRDYRDRAPTPFFDISTTAKNLAKKKAEEKRAEQAAKKLAQLSKVKVKAVKTDQDPKEIVYRPKPKANELPEVDL